MGVTININGLTLCHKDSGGVVKDTLPDVCLAPGSPPVPTPFPNIAFSRDLAGGATTVFADGGNMIANYGSRFCKSTGDEAGSQGGVVSGAVAAEATWLSFSLDVFFEGRPACRLTDQMLMNHGNTVSLGGLFQLDLKTDDAVKYVLCQILCETLEKGKKKHQKWTSEANKLTDKYKDELAKATKKMFGEGAEHAFEKTCKVAIKKGAMKHTARTAMSAGWLRKKFAKMAAATAGKKLVKKMTKAAAAKVVAKFIPVVNVISIAWDVYDVASTGYEVYKMVDQFMNKYQIFRIRPDFMVTSPNGQVGIYDMKFGKDSFSRNKGQYELYEEAGGKKPTEISKKKCNNCQKK